MRPKRLIAFGAALAVLTSAGLATLELVPSGARAQSPLPPVNVTIGSAHLVGNVVVGLDLTVACFPLPPFSGNPPPQQGSALMINVQLLQAINRTNLASGQANNQFDPNGPAGPTSGTPVPLCNGSLPPGSPPNVPQTIHLTVTPNMNGSGGVPFSGGQAYIQVGVQACNGFQQGPQGQNNGPSQPQPAQGADCEGGGTNGVVQIAGP